MKINYLKKNIYNSNNPRLFLFFSLKLLYATASLTIYKQPSIIKLSKLDKDLFFPPPGPFQLFSGFPDETYIFVIEKIIMLLIISYIFLPLKNLYVPILICSLKILIAGLSYSLGFISHDLLYLLFPLIIYFIYQDVINKFHKFFKILCTLLGLYFLQSGLSKLFSFWLSLESSAVRDWLLYYKSFYNVTSLLGNLIIEHPYLSEIIDWVTVLTEIIIGLLFLSKKLSVIKYLIPFLIIFNYSILLVFRIDFSKNYFLYLVLIIYLLKIENNKTVFYITSYFVILIFYIFAEINFDIKFLKLINKILKISDFREFISLYFFFGYVFLVFFRKLTLDETKDNLSNKIFIKYYFLMLFWIPVPFGYEIYPSLTGPHFLGTKGYYPTEFSMYVDDQQINPNEYFQIESFHLFKLISFLQPETTSYLGHSTLNRKLYILEINEYLTKNNIEIIWNP